MFKSEAQQWVAFFARRYEGVAVVTLSQSAYDDSYSVVIRTRIHHTTIILRNYLAVCSLINQEV